MVTKCNQLKLTSKDGKMRETDVADIGVLFRLIQSIPSPKAEPFKIWLAEIGYERMRETVDPELAANRARETWLALGRSKQWVDQRMRGIQTRGKLTDYWVEHGIKKGDEFAKLTNIIHEEWSGLNVKAHKNLKGLKSHNLRDHMGEAELLFSALAELSAREISEKKKLKDIRSNEVAAKKGGQIAGGARKALESQIGKSIVAGNNFLPPKKDRKELK